MTPRIKTEIITVRPEFPGAAVTGFESFTTDQLAKLTPAVIAKLFLDPLPDRLLQRPGENLDDVRAGAFRRRKAALCELPPEQRLKAVAAIYELKATARPDPPPTVTQAIIPQRDELIPAKKAVQAALAPGTLTALTVGRDPLPLKMAIVDVPDGAARKNVFGGVLGACLDERRRRLNQLKLQAQTGTIDAEDLERGKQQADGVLLLGVNTLASMDGRGLRHLRPTLKILARQRPDEARLVVKALKPTRVLALGEAALEWATPEQLAAAARSNAAGALPHILEAVTAIDGDACTPSQTGFGLLEEVTGQLAAGPNAARIAKRIQNLAERGDDAAIEAAAVLGLQFDKD